MPIPVINFPVSSFGSSFVEGMSHGSNLINNILASRREQMLQKYLPQTLEEQIKQLQYATPVKAAEAKYAEPNAIAALNELINRGSLLGQQSQWYAPSTQTDIAYKKMMTKKLEEEAKNPLLNLSGVAGQIGAAQYLTQHPEIFGKTQPQTSEQQQQTQPLETQLQQISSKSGYQTGNPMADLILNTANTSQRKSQATIDYLTKQTQGYEWSKLPVQNKAQVIAQGVGLGYTPEEAGRLLANGVSLRNMAKAKGFEPDQPETWSPASYPPTTRTLTQNQQSNIAQSAIREISPVLTEALAPYAKSWNGKSLKSIIDATSGKNVEERAKALAAGAVQMELQTLRARSGGLTNFGIETLKEMLSASGNRLQQLGPTITPELYRKSQKYIDKYQALINKAENREFNKIGRTYGVPSGMQEEVDHGVDPAGLLSE